MAASITLTLNGSQRTFHDLGDEPTVAKLVTSLGFRADRVALERNGEIVPRSDWASTQLTTGERIELVHFVGGG